MKKTNSDATLKPATYNLDTITNDHSNERYIITVGNLLYADVDGKLCSGKPNVDKRPEEFLSKDLAEEALIQAKGNMTEFQKTRATTMSISESFADGFLIVGKDEEVVEGVYFSKQFTTVGDVFANKKKAERERINFKPKTGRKKLTKEDKIERLKRQLAELQDA